MYVHLLVYVHIYICICVHVYLHVCVHMHACISWLCPLKRSKSRDIPEAMSTADAQILIPNTIPTKKKAGVPEEVAESRTGEG